MLEGYLKGMRDRVSDEASEEQVDQNAADEQEQQQIHAINQDPFSDTALDLGNVRPANEDADVTQHRSNTTIAS